jgi:hypothetical protein
MQPSSSSLLRKLEATRLNYGPSQAKWKLQLLASLEKKWLPSRPQVLRLHEHLCFLRAYPDNPAVLARVRRMLDRFGERSDFRRHQTALDDTGMAGTVIHFRFFWPSARWLAERWPKQLEIDWENVESLEPLAAALLLLVTPLESQWLRLCHPDTRQVFARLRGSRTTDATFFVRRVQSMAGDHVTREAFFDNLDLPFLLRPCPGTPSRTRAEYRRAPIVFRDHPPSRHRPDLSAELTRPPRSVRGVSPTEGQVLIDLARGAMATRERDLDNFAYGDPRDVRIVDDGDGLQWALIGTLPERRPALRATYGALTLRNGVPIGYVGIDALFKCADLSYNTFTTFRGGEAAFVFARTLAALGPIFRPRSFTIEPYQLGDHNDEAIESGAWWFYFKLGFRPRNPEIRKLGRKELARMTKFPRYRSSQRTLRRLAQDYLYFETSGARAPHWPSVVELGEKVAARLAAVKDADREAALYACLEEASRLLDRSWPRHADPHVRNAWKQWSVVIPLLPGIRLWSSQERIELARVISAKGGRRDSDYLKLFDAHPKLGQSLRALTGA